MTKLRPGSRCGAWTLMERSAFHHPSGAAVWSAKRDDGLECMVRNQGRGRVSVILWDELIAEDSFGSFVAMLTRCTSPAHGSYDDYSHLGVCRRWKPRTRAYRDVLAAFRRFRDDMGSRPEGHSLHRMNSGKGYSPSNCVWATRSEQERAKHE